jgi:hypothetical protein
MVVVNLTWRWICVDSACLYLGPYIFSELCWRTEEIVLHCFSLYSITEQFTDFRYTVVQVILSQF